MDEPVFLSRERVLQLHGLSLQQHGGLDGLREPGLFDSALMQADATYHYGRGDLAAIAAAYAFHIAQNQPFLDGNNAQPSPARWLFSSSTEFPHRQSRTTSSTTP
jgi:death-on-curing protein